MSFKHDYRGTLKLSQETGNGAISDAWRSSVWN